MPDFLGLNGHYWSGLIATVVVVLFYVLAAVSRPPDGGWRANPLAITAGVTGRASLSNLQVFYFSLIVFWVLTYFVVETRTLVGLNLDVLKLLGIGAAGTVGAKVTAVTRKRLSSEDWAWLKRKNWISQDIERARRPPQWTDLITSGADFDVYKFQTLVVSFIVGIALVAAGMAGTDPIGLKNFKIDDNLLALLGLSQAVYVGGKAIGPATNANLKTQLDKLRKLEQVFIAAAAKEWKKTALPQANANMAAAINAAPVEYNAYLTAAEDTAVMVQERIGAAQPTTNIAPDLPVI